MVGFLRKKKSDKVLLGDETVLERKGRVDGASLLDDNGDPTDGTLYNQNRLPLKKGGRKGSDEENNAPPQQLQPPVNGQYPPANYPYGQTYPPQTGYGYPQQQQQQPAGAFGQPAQNVNSGIQGFVNGRGSFGNSRGKFGQQPQGPAPPQQQYGGQPQYGNPQQYPQQYGNYPPQQPQVQKKSSFFRIPGYGKK